MGRHLWARTSFFPVFFRQWPALRRPIHQGKKSVTARNHLALVRPQNRLTPPTQESYLAPVAPRDQLTIAPPGDHLATQAPSNRNTDKPQGNAGIETPPSNTGTERPHGSAGGIKASADTRNTQRPPDGKDDGTSRDNDTATEGSVRNQAENEQPRCNQTAPSLTSAKPSDRALRFVTIPQTHVDTMPPFYDGDHVSERMASVRKSIDYIRTTASCSCFNIF